MKSFLLVSFVAFFLIPSMVWSQPRIAITPFENLSGIRVAPIEVMPVIESTIAKKGYQILQKELLEKFLEEERIRFLDSIPTPITQKLAEKFGLEATLTGTILSYVSGINPQVGLSARLIGKNGKIIWGQSIGITGEDTMGILELGKVEKIQNLVQIAANRLFETIDVKERGVNLTGRGGIKQVIMPNPRVFRSKMLDSKEIFRIGVFPLDNWSTNREAGRIFLNLLILRLSNKKLSNVTEPADVREIMIAEGIRSFDELDPDQIRKLQEKINTRFFVGGTIYKYSEGLGAYGTTSPEVEINLTMLDAETGRIVWSSNHTRKGQDYMTFLEFGLIRNSVSLADQVLSEMVATMKITGHK
jgi:TolB-like protein